MTADIAGQTGPGQQSPILVASRTCSACGHSSRPYTCALCGAVLPDGAHVAADYDTAGALAGVRADVDPDGDSLSVVHSCGTLTGG